MNGRDRVETTILLAPTADRVLTTYMSRGFLTCGDVLVLGEDLGRVVVSPRLLFIWPLERERDTMR